MVSDRISLQEQQADTALHAHGKMVLAAVDFLCGRFLESARHIAEAVRDLSHAVASIEGLSPALPENIYARCYRAFALTCSFLCDYSTFVGDVEHADIRRFLLEHVAEDVRGIA